MKEVLSFSALAVQGVGPAAFQMVEEARGQFPEIPGLLTGEADPGCARCIDISTRNALREMIAPTALAAAMSVIAGSTAGVWALAALLSLFVAFTWLK